jgi:hypothetical protein
MVEPGSPETDQRAPSAWLDGTDPAGWADTAGMTDPFPPPLDSDARPADGPWTDARLLARREEVGDHRTDPPEALLADLASAEGDPDAGWATLSESDDPAVRALALRWRP